MADIFNGSRELLRESLDAQRLGFLLQGRNKVRVQPFIPKLPLGLRDGIESMRTQCSRGLAVLS